MGEGALVTGGAGFVGLHLVRRLVEEGQRVTVVDDLSRGASDAALGDLLPHVRFVRHDLTRPLDDAVEGSFDVVYHLAAMVGVARAGAEPARVLRTNLLSALNVVDWCTRNPPDTLFLSSTSEVADGAAATGLASYPVDEDVPFVLVAPRLPRTSYALSKVVAEALLLHSSGPFRVRIARYHNVYGPRMGCAHVVPQMIGRLLAGVDPFPVYGSDQRRAFCYVDDAVEATIRLARLPAPHPVVANVGDDREEVRILDLAHRLFRLADAAPEVVPVGAPAGSPERRLPDLTALRSLTGYEPTVDLDAGLARTYAWYAAQPAVAVAE